MKLRMIACGLVGGLLGTGALLGPLYRVLPSSYSSAWAGDSDWILGYWLAVIGTLIAVLVAVATGYCAARWCWAEKASAGLKAGALSGLLAGAVMFCMIGAGAAGVVGNGPVFLHGLQPVEGPQELQVLTAHAVVRSVWCTYLTFYAMLGGTVILSAISGCLAGWFSGWRDLDGWGEMPANTDASSGTAAAVGLMFVIVGVLLFVIIHVGTLSQLASEVLVPQTTYGNVLGRGIVHWPVGTNLIVLAMTMAWCWSTIAPQWRHPHPAVNRSARFWAFISIFIVAFVLAGLYLYGPDLANDPVFVAGAGLLLLATLMSIRKAEQVPDKEVETDNTAPTRLDHLIGEALFVSIVYTAFILGGGIAVAVSLAAGVVAFLNGPTAMPSVEGSIQNLFLMQGTVSMLVAASILAIWFLATALLAQQRRRSYQ